MAARKLIEENSLTFYLYQVWDEKMQGIFQPFPPLKNEKDCPKQWVIDLDKTDRFTYDETYGLLQGELT